MLHMQDVLAQTTRDSTDPEPVDRVMYASVSLVQGSVYSEMERIRAAAVRNNVPLRVSTALLHQSGWFVQWKEGPAEAIADIIARVRGDPRHHSLRVLHHSHGSRMLPEMWSMAIVQVPEKPTDFARRVLALRSDFERGVQYAPTTVWRRLSTPMLANAGTEARGEPESFHRLMVCAAHSEDAFALVRWLAEQAGTEIVHRRFAGVTELDVGTDYVDFVDEGQALRVIAMARNGLRMGLTRAFLPDYSHVLLLFRGDPERDLNMLRRVAQACQGVRQVPRVLGLGLSLEEHQAMYQTARNLGLHYEDCADGPLLGPAQTWRSVRPCALSSAAAANSAWPVLSSRYV